MSNLINRDDLIDKINSSIESKPQDDFDSGYNTAMTELREIIKNLPSFDEHDFVRKDFMDEEIKYIVDKFNKSILALREDRDCMYKRYSEMLALNTERIAMKPTQLIVPRYFLNKWISFKDRLPADGDRVLVCFSDGVMSVFWRSGDKMTDGLRHFLISETMPDDTYWITLPKRPEKFDEKDDFIEDVMKMIDTDNDDIIDKDDLIKPLCLDKQT